MKDERYKKSKLVSSAITEYFFSHNAQSIEIKVDYSDSKFIVSARAKLNKNPENLEELSKILNSKQSEDLELYYTELLEFSHGSRRDLELLSSLIDKADVDYKDKILNINIEKHLD